MVPSGSFSRAQKVTSKMKQEPYKMIRTLVNAAHHGAGVDLDRHLPKPQLPCVRSKDDLNKKGALISLADAEPKQNLVTTPVHVWLRYLVFNITQTGC